MRNKIEWVGFITLFLFLQFLFAGCYSIFVGLSEANTTVFLTMPGTVSLLFFLLPFKSLPWLYRLGCVIASTLLTVIVNQWHLVGGNKEWVFLAQLTLFIGCSSFCDALPRKKLRQAASLLFAFCTAGILWQTWLEEQFHQANVCMVKYGEGCGASGRCFQYYAAQRCDSGEPIGGELFDAEEYINIWFSYANHTPTVNFEGLHTKSAQYLLCGSALQPVNDVTRAECR